MNAGDLRHRITIKTPNWGDAPTGERVITSWTSSGDHRAAFRPLSARERLSAGAGMEIAQATTHVITMRYIPGVRADCRVVMLGTEYEIDHVIDVDMRGIELRILVHELSP